MERHRDSAIHSRVGVGTHAGVNQGRQKKDASQLDSPCRLPPHIPLAFFITTYSTIYSFRGKACSDPADSCPTGPSFNETS